ncbi:MAG: immunoglobulin domain-containing protein, partial [Prevotellaceae bacterium]|nr:immunoglobulin domain-containing protein [Prevotellaceae bacterium]
DDIRLKYNSAPTPTKQAPSITTDLNAEYSVNQGGALALTIGASGNPTPTYQWYSNTTATIEGATAIDGATDVTYNVPTTTIGDVYYYCVATNSEGSATSTIAKVTVAEKPASKSKNGQSYQEGDNWFLMLQDFEDNEIDDSYTVVNSEGGTAKVQADPKEVSEKSLNFITGNYKSNEYVKIDITLPTSVVLDDKFTDLYFDMVYNTLGDNNNKTVKVKIDSNDLGSISTGNAPKNWETKNYSLSGKTTSENSFSFCIGWENANYANYFIDNIRLKYKEAPTPVGPTSGDCGDDAHWAYDAATTSLTITGIGEMTDFAEGATPWNAYLSAITTIDVAEGITKVGANAFKGINSSAVLTFHSIPAFGAYAVVEGEANLALVDANHPFVANTTENAPTFANISYARTLDANKWATVILPFVPEYDANTEFFKFKEATSSEATFQQTYSLEAGVPYVFRRTADSGDFTLSATNVAGSSLVVNPVNPSAGSVSFKGTFETLEKGYGVFAMKDNNFITVDAQHIITVAPFRAYLETLAPVGSTISIKVLDVTGIEKTISDEKQTPNVFYNLQGLRVNGNYKGVILMNGKKFIAQ